MHKETCRKFKELSRGYISHRDGAKMQMQACPAQVPAASRTPTSTRPLAKQLGFLCYRADIHAAFSHWAGHCRWYLCNIPLENWNLIFGGWGSCWSSEVKKACGLKWEVLTSKMAEFISTELLLWVHHHQWKDTALRSIPRSSSSCGSFLWEYNGRLSSCYLDPAPVLTSALGFHVGEQTTGLGSSFPW